jgi:hypothetical protein
MLRRGRAATGQALGLCREPVDLVGPTEVLDNRALGARLTSRERTRVNALLDQPRVEDATVMSDLANS